MMKKILIIILSVSGLLFQIFAKPIAEFNGAKNLDCKIIHIDNTITKCNQSQKFILKAYDKVITDQDIYIRVMSDNIEVIKEKEGNKYVYIIQPKTTEEKGMLSFIKEAISFTKKYSTYGKGAATRGVENLSNLNIYNPPISLASKDDLISIQIPKDKVFEEPVLLEIYPSMKREKAIIKLNLKQTDDGEFYIFSFKPQEYNLKPSEVYFWIIKDSKFDIQGGLLYVLDTGKEIKNLVNSVYPRLKIDVDDNLKKALLYAKLGYLWKTKNILANRDLTKINKNYKDELFKYLNVGK